MTELFEMTFGRFFALLTDSAFTTYYTIFCALIVCVLFHVFILRKAAKKGGVTFSAAHFVGVYIFLIYIAFVYIVTGLGTVWDIAYYVDLRQVAEVYWIPFGTFEMEYALSNVVSYALNIVMMMPFGFMLALIWPQFRSLKKVALTGFVFAAAIEISQLFNHRATTVDDLIMNTLGAVIGCLVFMVFYKLAAKKGAKKSGAVNVGRYSAGALRHEAVIYLVCSFMGVFLLFNSMMYVDWSANRGGGQAFEDELVEIVEEYTSGILLEVREDSILIDIVKRYEAADGSIVGGDTGVKMEVMLYENTVVEIWQSDSSGMAEPVVIEVTKDELGNRELVDVYLKEGSDSEAEKIVVWRFVG